MIGNEYAVASIDYRSAKDAKLPGQLSDCKAASSGRFISPAATSSASGLSAGTIVIGTMTGSAGRTWTVGSSKRS